LLLTLLFGGKWAALIPMATLAGILVVVAYNMSEWKHFLTLLKGPRSDMAILLTTVDCISRPDRCHRDRYDPGCLFIYAQHG
jgi:MFS superfamily sulfate permease-like transporter